MSVEICLNELDNDVTKDCDNPSGTGVKKTAKIFNLSDINENNIMRVVGQSNILSALPAKSGKKAFELVVSGNNPFDGTKVEKVEGVSVKFNSTLQFIVTRNDPEFAEIARKLADPDNDYVVVIENKSQNESGNNAFQIIGLEKGAKCTAAVHEKYSTDTDGGWLFTFVETEHTKYAEQFFFNTDKETTRAAFDAMTDVA